MRYLALAISLVVCFISMAQAADNNSTTLKQYSQWQDVLKQADGQTVYFNAWGGRQDINQYLRWAKRELQRQYNVTLVHVKVADISESTQRLIAQKAAGKHKNGSIDLVWFNGENFRSMKEHDTLFGPFTHLLPNMALVDTTLPVDEDFSEPTLGLEAPWGVGQLVFIYDEDTLAIPPKNVKELLSLAQQQPGKITYPKPPEFHGSSFLKAALLELTTQQDALYQPIDSTLQAEQFQQVSKPLWDYLDQLHKVAWNQGKRFPSSSAETINLLDDQQTLIAISFNPNAAMTAIEQGNLAETAKTFAFEQGALSNIHFLAIPKNSSAKAGALVAINFLLSPQAQARKANVENWGDPSVLKKANFSKQDKQAIGREGTLYKAIKEPHPSWISALEKEWQVRYSQ